MESVGRLSDLSAVAVAEVEPSDTLIRRHVSTAAG